MSDPSIGGMGAADMPTAGISGVQARIAEIQGRFGGASFASVLTSASATKSDASAVAAATNGDPAALASALGVDPSALTGGSTSSASGPGKNPAAGSATAVLDEAKKYLGVKYVWGGESPSGFDCSGLVQYVYGKFGVNLPRVAADQASAGRAVSAADARPGDLVFYGKPATHVGIYLGNNRMLDAPNSHSVVRTEKLWSNVSGFRRVLPDAAFAAAPKAASVKAATPVGASTSSAATSGSAAMLAAKLPAAGKPYAAAIVTAANHNGIDPKLLAALVWQESNFSARAVSAAGARGLVQLMPATARGLGVDPMNPAQALDGGARYLKEQLQTFGRADLALAAYNAGPSAVRKYGGVPPYRETQSYVARIQNKMTSLS
jgi:cell wall-associated NlpC family hydrolase